MQDSDDPTKCGTVDTIGLLVREKSDISGKPSEHCYGNNCQRKNGGQENCGDALMSVRLPAPSVAPLGEGLCVSERGIPRLALSFGDGKPDEFRKL